ncbi:MAG: glycosyltransferase family 4 protein [Bacteroidales bacterium]|uniref:glycosyltransferase family 4 protein n=1 Tax=Candidatus Cryptobacteroides sp. TaxID=2952915 RepID=UPI002A763C7B|nr:glycosyltransferase family 4 protein [Candidatus Cryptobacteroides sp.]MCI6526761.1 glycosyltransferase family 4 protein [Bacteroidales bacterium]MDD5915745.1 glycosyltransferase family 4 protein [Bacteroidales bacterium]MDD7136451.1 glycosyltransferase family 4 protein [Bacteroidales bacterium]MDD7234354.1 glycosyltransferase family 4 protein [Bacteroidales bacterium]MDY2700920.1 glycosyltransferase family 4 protein [Candidatus Cryptobacteroides sp.]
MRVLMFGWEFPPHIAGGLGTACEGIVKGLAYNGVETLFVMPSASGDEDQSATTIINASDVAVDTASSTVDEFLDKVKFVHIGTNMIPYVGPEEFSSIVEEERRRQTEDFRIQYGMKYKFSGKYGTNLMEEVARYAMVGGTIAMQHKDEFDVIHAHDWLTYLAGIAAKELTGKPLVVHVHATSYDRGDEKHIDTRILDIETRGMLAADRVVTVSNLTRSIVINKYHIDPSKVVTVHNAVDFSGRENLSVERGVKDKVVTFLGRITFQKGPEYFIEAAAKVLKRTDNVRFVMAGSGDMMNRCIKYVARLGISDRFHFTGFLRGKDVQKMFALSDVYIMPSVSEPFGISPLEAMRTNVPSIISHQSGAAEILKYAFKVDFWDVDAMADCIFGLLKYPALSSFAAKQGYDEVNRLKWNVATAKLKTIYESLIQK